MTLLLLSGGLSLSLCPEAGGSIAAFRYRGADLLRPADANAIASRAVRAMGCYPLLPYSNRIRHGRFRLGDDIYQLGLNFGDHPHSIHGFGWQSSWNILQQTPESARLGLVHRPDDNAARARWPFALSATQSFDLDEDGLTISLSITNDDKRAFPAGLGLHPYFPRNGQTLVQADCGGVWMNGDDMIPVEHNAIPPQWDLREPTLAARLGLDNCFDGWMGRARVLWPDRRLGLTIEADPVFSHLVVFSPEARDFVCLEPVSHRNDGFNAWARGEDGTGVRLLEPGLSMTGIVRFSLFEWR